MRLRSQIAITGALAVAMAAGWFALAGGRDAAQSGETPRKRSAATLVLVEPLKLAENRVIVRAIGTSVALKSASIHPSADGEVVKVAFAAGQRVVEGAPLIRLDDTHQRLAVRLAQVEVKEARRQLKRFEKLARSGATTLAKLQTTQAELESALLRLDQTNAVLRDRTVYAPFDGVIGLTEIEKGDRVTRDTLIATLDDRSLIVVEFNLPEKYAGRIKTGDFILALPWTMPDLKMQGAVTATGSRIDPVTRSLRVKARIDNPDDTIRPGTSFEVQLAFKGRSYPSVREIAVMWSRDGAYLWRAVGDRAEKVFVDIIRRDRGRILLDGPLRAGDQIVVEGVQGLRVGQKLKTAPYKTGDAATRQSGKKP